MVRRYSFCCCTGANTKTASLDVKLTSAQGILQPVFYDALCLMLLALTLLGGLDDEEA